MTDDEAQSTVEQSEHVATLLVKLCVSITKPDVSIVAFGLAAGFVFANLEYEDGINMDEVFDNWLDAVKCQYEETKKQIADYKKQ